MRQRLLQYVLRSTSCKVQYEDYVDSDWTLSRTHLITEAPASTFHDVLNAWKPVILKAIGAHECWEEENLMITEVKLNRLHNEVSYLTFSAVHTNSFESGIMRVPFKVTFKRGQYTNGDFPIRITRLIANIDREAIRYLNGWNNRSVSTTPPEVYLSEETEADLGDDDQSWQLKTYAGEPCRICGVTLTNQDLDDAVFVDYSQDQTARAAHLACWESRGQDDPSTWTHP